MLQYTHQQRKYDMNERIKELESDCWEYRPYGPPWFNAERFADMIINICIDSLWTEECRVSDLAMKEFTRNGDQIWRQFGVGK